MVETAPLQPQNAPKDSSQEASPAVPSAGNGGAQPAQEAKFQHTTIKGRLNQYTSAFWAVAIPMLSARYVGRWASNLLHLEESPNFFKRRAYGFGVGAVMMGVTGIYASRTKDDMKRVFAEAVGWEMDKKPEDVGLRDLWNSKNSVVHGTMVNFVKYNTRRFALTNLPFFNFLIPGVLSKAEGAVVSEEVKKATTGMSIYNSVDLGVGATGLYLATDVLSRKETFFERLQNFIDQKINHSDRLGEAVTAMDLVNLYDRHMQETPHAMSSTRMDTDDWKNKQKLFERMAELMNQTYGNTPKQEAADFTVPKLIYLLGMGLEKSDSLKKNLAYVEVANRYGIPAVKELSVALEQGAELQTALARFPVEAKKAAAEANLPITPADNAMLSSTEIASEPVAAAAGKTFANDALKQRPLASVTAAASHLDKATQSREGAATALSAG